jgi:hypothetical protein
VIFQRGFPGEAFIFDLSLETQATWWGRVSGREHSRPWVQMGKSRTHDRGCWVGTLSSWEWPEVGDQGPHLRESWDQARQWHARKELSHYSVSLEDHEGIWSRQVTARKKWQVFWGDKRNPLKILSIWLQNF